MTMMIPTDDNDEDRYENDDVWDDESIDEDMQVETVGKNYRSEGDEHADEEAEEIAGAPIAEENAGGPSSMRKQRKLEECPLQKKMQECPSMELQA